MLPSGSASKMVTSALSPTQLEDLYQLTLTLLRNIILRRPINILACLLCLSLNFSKTRKLRNVVPLRQRLFNKCPPVFLKRVDYDRREAEQQS